MKKKVIIIGAIVLIAGGIGYYIYSSNKKKKAAVLGGENVRTSGGYTTPIHAELKWVQNEKAASYLYEKLSPKEMKDLKGWVNLIKSQRAKDASKWKEGNGGLMGQVSDIGHAMYQMKIWNNDVLSALKGAQ